MIIFIFYIAIDDIIKYYKTSIKYLFNILYSCGKYKIFLFLYFYFYIYLSNTYEISF